MGKSIIDSAYDHNKKVWHRRRDVAQLTAMELHHIYGRVGIARCCLALFAPGAPGHQLDWAWVDSLRVKHANDYAAAQSNFVRKLGCKSKIFECCNYCYFFRRGNEQTK